MVIPTKYAISMLVETIKKIPVNLSAKSSTYYESLL